VKIFMRLMPIDRDGLPMNQSAKTLSSQECDIFSIKRFTSAYSAFDGFIDQIKAISDGFEKWRYSYESTAHHYDISFALAFIESIKSAASEVRN